MATSEDLKENPRNKELEMKLMQACRFGRVNVVDSLLAMGVNVNSMVERASVPLVLASMNGHFEVAKMLIDHGADLNERDGRKQTALMSASGEGHDKIVELLLEHGADVNMRDGYNCTALMPACVWGRDKCVALLVAYGADVKVRDKDGLAPLTIACTHGYDKIVEILADNGADVIDSDDYRVAPLWSACAYGYDKVVEILLKHGAYDHLTLLAPDSLLAASGNGHDKVVALLLSHGFDVNEMTMYMETALMYACEGGHLEVAKTLIESGADVNVVDCFGQTVLMRLCKSCDVNEEDYSCVFDFMRLLFQRGADADTQCRKLGRTAAMLAVLSHNILCLRALLGADPDLDLVDLQGKTVFSHAMNDKSPECLRVLLQYGDLRTTDGRLKPVHRDNYNDICTEDSLLVTIEFGVFEWKWCSSRDYRNVAIAVLGLGHSPRETTFGDGTFVLDTDKICLSPLVMALVMNDKALVRICTTNLFYLPKDYRVLSTNEKVRRSIGNKALLKGITHRMMSLQSLSFLAVSNSITAGCPPCTRRQRVDALPIPEKFKYRLNFEEFQETFRESRCFFRNLNRYDNLEALLCAPNDQSEGCFRL